jgi:IS30 family transposase
MWVSPETIYQSIYVQGRGALRRELATCLRTGRALRRPRRQAAARRARTGPVPAMVSISERPAEAADRAVPGHWEGDLERHEAPCNRAEVEGLRRCAVAAA